ncbi:WD40/YVTN/BNR-like repeat-containing protein [Variovorax sp. HJSM1_2]|uniref:WD40/YVTN/BNR-like repeat-containing protein n=1 Tax=Variovorax sp. HJSM1_2 TaxID=3366263 RepID=UPI003BE24F76
MTVTDALQRPAVMARQPERSVTLSAARAGKRLVAVGERGLILLSDDQGTQWRQSPCPVSVTLTTVRFADAQHGVAVGHGGVVLTTADAGETWTLRLDGQRLAQLVLATAKASGDAAHIRDAERLVADGADKPLLDILAWDAHNLLAIGAYGLALHSSDGGKSWTSWMERLPNPRALHLYSIRRAGNTLLIAGEQGLILRSDDAGARFHALSTPYKGSWFTAELLSDQRLVLAGLRGNAWRSEDGGTTWVQLASPMPASITASAQGQGGELWMTNQAGYVLRLQGNTLVPLHRQALAPLTGLLGPESHHSASEGLVLAITGPQRMSLNPGQEASK